MEHNFQQTILHRNAYLQRLSGGFWLYSTTSTKKNKIISLCNGHLRLENCRQIHTVDTVIKHSHSLCVSAEQPYHLCVELLFSVAHEFSYKLWANNPTEARSLFYSFVWQHMTYFHLKCSPTPPPLPLRSYKPKEYTLFRISSHCHSLQEVKWLIILSL